MNLNDIAQQCTDDSRAWFPTIRQRPLDWEPIDYEIDHHLKALAGEIGEVLNLWKKFERGTHTRIETIAALKDELADVFTYFMGLPTIVGFDLQEEYDVKREYNKRRFGGGVESQSTEANGTSDDHLPIIGDVSS
jgi:NTP pyrophosphatase (non-canonical NTP hydrolase)